MDRSLHQLLFFRQWAGNLRSNLPHALVVGTNAHTCAVLRNESIPCFVDKLAPPLTGKQNFFGSQVLLKWWYARALLGLRYHLVFSDPDIAWVRDPFSVWDESYDVQGLSDIRSVNLTEQRVGAEGFSGNASSECLTTSLVSPHHSPHLLQLLVMRYLIGVGDELPPLRFRLLPTWGFVNIEYYEERRQQGLDISRLVATHCGYLKNTADKLEHLEINGFLERGLAWHQALVGALSKIKDVNASASMDG
ncbi:MAG: hypothetical protein SGPRY_005981 [Prymnesium sp.]